jgi:ATP synthase protein I
MKGLQPLRVEASISMRRRHAVTASCIAQPRSYNNRAMPDGPEQRPNLVKSYVKAESMIQLAIALPAGCLIGWLVGAWLDRRFQQDWIAIAGIVLGAAGGFVQIFRAASRYLKKDE